MNQREIKFRAWDKIKNTWIFNSNITPFHIIGEITVFGMLNQYSIDKLNDIIIMQFTGLRNDINGREPFDGDIVKYYLPTTIDGDDDNETEYIEAIEWGCCGFELDGTSLSLLEDIPFEIIGDIYTNPELLK